MDNGKYVDIYRRYLNKFEQMFGELDFNEPVQHQGKLIGKLRFDDFVEKWTEYKETEKYLREVMSKGATINNEINRTYVELSAYVLEDPSDFVAFSD
jgi:hypothetical protein